MPTIRRLVRVLVACWLVSLGDRGADPICLGGAPPPRDLVLVNSFANKEDSTGLPLLSHQLGFLKDERLLSCYCNAPTFPEVGSVRLWDIKTGRQVPYAETEEYPRPMPFHWYSFSTLPHPRLCFWTTSGLEVQDDLTRKARRSIGLKLLEPGIDVEGWVVHPIKGDGAVRMGRVFFSANDEYVAVLRHDKSVHVWKTRTGEHVWRFVLPPEVSPDACEIRSMAFDPKNRYLAAGLDNLTALIVWDLKTGKEALHVNVGFRVFQVAFFRNGDLTYGGGDSRLESGTVEIRRAGDLDDVIQSNHTPCGVTCLAVVPGSGIATGDWHGQVILWHVDPNKTQSTPDGRLLAMAVAKENGLHVVSLTVGQDGGLLAAGDSDSVVRVWKIVSPQPPTPPAR